MTASKAARFSDMLAAMGAEVRLNIMKMLLSAHPDGMVVGDIQAELDVPGSTLSHHLEKLRMEGLVTVRRDARRLWYSANTSALQELLQYLYVECCAGNEAIQPAFVKKRRSSQRPGKSGVRKNTRTKAPRSRTLSAA